MTEQLPKPTVSYSYHTSETGSIVGRIHMHDVDCVLILAFDDVRQLNITLDSFKETGYSVQTEANYILNSFVSNDNALVA